LKDLFDHFATELPLRPDRIGSLHFICRLTVRIVLKTSKVYKLPPHLKVH